MMNKLRNTVSQFCMQAEVTMFVKNAQFQLNITKIIPKEQSITINLTGDKCLHLIFIEHVCKNV